MKKTISVVLLLICSLVASVNSLAKKDVQSLDKIVAVINDDVITKTELSRALMTAKMTLSQQNVPMPKETVLQKQVLDQLINKKLQLQVAEQAGVQTSDDELDNAIGRIATQNNVSIDTLYDQLGKEGMSPVDYRREMRDQMTMQKLQQQEVAGKVTITPEEVNSFLHSRTWTTNTSKEYRLEDILIPLSDAPTPDEIAKANQHAQSVIAKLHAGKNFKEIAQTESGAVSALEGGDLGWRRLSEVPSAFYDQVSRMKAKEVAGPIQTPNGFHIIRLTDMRVDKSTSMPDHQQVEAQLLQQKFEQAVQNWVSKLRSQAFVTIT